MTINGVELEFDLLDYETAKAYEEALERVQKESALCQKKKAISVSASIKEQCEMVNRFFDKVFGAGTSQAIFGGKMNLNVAIEAFEAVIEEAAHQKEAFSSRINKNISKWKAC